MYVAYTMYSKSLEPIATNIVRTINPWTTTGTTVAFQNQIVDSKPTTNPLTQMPETIVTYANGYQERLQVFGSSGPRQRTVY